MKERIREVTVYVIVVLLAVCTFPSSVKAELLGSLPHAPIPSQTLQDYMLGEVRSTPELARIQTKAKELTLEVWLWGDSAAIWGHYQKLKYLAQDPKESRFNRAVLDDAFISIFREHDPVQMYVAGPPEKKESFRLWLLDTYPEAIRWELYSETSPGYSTLQSNPNAYQALDQYGTTAIRISPLTKGAPLISQVGDLSAPHPTYLKELASGTMAIAVPDETHPEIPLAFQAFLTVGRINRFGVSLDRENLGRLMGLIRGFDWYKFFNKGDPGIPSASMFWLQKYVLPSLLYPFDLPHALDFLESSTLNRYLGHIQHSLGQTLASRTSGLPLFSYFEKEALRNSSDLKFPAPRKDSPNARTAKDLGLTHVTYSPHLSSGGNVQTALKDAIGVLPSAIYDAVRFSPSSQPNVFVPALSQDLILRTGLGRKPLQPAILPLVPNKDSQQPYPIFFRVSPSAREGEAFTIEEDGKLLWRDRLALKFDDSPFISDERVPSELVRDFLKGNREGIGLLSTSLRQAAFSTLTPDEKKRVGVLIQTAIKSLGERSTQGWRVPTGPSGPDGLEIPVDPEQTLTLLLDFPLLRSLPKWDQWVTELIENGWQVPVVENIFSSPVTLRHPKLLYWLQLIIENESAVALIRNYTHSPVISDVIMRFLRFPEVFRQEGGHSLLASLLRQVSQLPGVLRMLFKYSLNPALFSQKDFLLSGEVLPLIKLAAQVLLEDFNSDRTIGRADSRGLGNEFASSVLETREFIHSLSEKQIIQLIEILIPVGPDGVLYSFLSREQAKKYESHWESSVYQCGNAGATTWVLIRLLETTTHFSRWEQVAVAILLREPKALDVNLVGRIKYLMGLPDVQKHPRYFRLMDALITRGFSSDDALARGLLKDIESLRNSPRVNTWKEALSQYDNSKRATLLEIPFPEHFPTSSCDDGFKRLSPPIIDEFKGIGT